VAILAVVGVGWRWAGEEDGRCVGLCLTGSQTREDRGGDCWLDVPRGDVTGRRTEQVLGFSFYLYRAGLPPARTQHLRWFDGRPCKSLPACVPPAWRMLDPALDALTLVTAAAAPIIRRKPRPAEPIEQVYRLSGSVALSQAQRKLLSEVRPGLAG
jgi:hypothetical protein